MTAPITIQEYAVFYTDKDGDTHLHRTGMGPVGRDIAVSAVHRGIPYWGTGHIVLVRDLTEWRTP